MTETPSAEKAKPLLSSLSPSGRIRFKLINIRGQEVFDYPCYAQNWYDIHKEFCVWIERASENMAEEIWDSKQYRTFRVILLHEDVVVTCLELEVLATTSSEGYIGYYPAEFTPQIDLHAINYKKYFSKGTHSFWKKIREDEWATVYHYYFNFSKRLFLPSLTADVDLSLYFLPEPEAKRPLNIWSLGR